jgi:hypothetical protein
MSFDTTLRDLMHDADNLMAADEPVKYARKQFELESVRSLILVDGSGPIGLLTRSRMRQIPESDMLLPARDFAVTVPILRQSQSLAEAQVDLGAVEFDADRIPVVNDNGQFVGVIDREVIKREAETVVTGRGMVRTSNGGEHQYMLEVGMEVLGADDNKLGKIDEITLEREYVAAFIIEHGLFGRHHKRVTAEHVTKVADGTVFLNFGKTEFGLLADIEERSEDTASVAAS